MRIFKAQAWKVKWENGEMLLKHGVKGFVKMWFGWKKPNLYNEYTEPRVGKQGPLNLQVSSQCNRGSQNTRS